MPTLTVEETIQAISEIEKEVWIPTLIDYQRYYTVFRDKFRREVKKLSPESRKIYMKVLKQGLHGYGVRSEAQSLPDAGGRDFATMYQAIHSYYGVIRMTGHAWKIPQATGKIEYLIDNLTHMFLNFQRNVYADHNRILLGDGSARVVQQDGAASYDAASNRTIVPISSITGHWSWVKKGCGYYLGTDTTERTCVFVDHSNMNIYFTGDLTALCSDEMWIYRRNQADDYSYEGSPEQIGILGHVSDDVLPYGDGTYQGVDRTDIVNDFARAITWEVDGYLDSMEMRKIFKEYRTHSDTYPSDVVCGGGVHNSFAALLKQNNTTTEAIVSDIGWGATFRFHMDGKPITINEIEDVPPGLMLILSMEDFLLAEPIAFRWNPTPKGAGVPNLQPISSGTTLYDVWQNWLENYWGVACEKPYNQMKVSGIVEDGVMAA